MAKKETILVICAHSDDQILGVGGTIAKYAKEGKTIKTIIFSYGEKSHPWLEKDVVIKMRVKESYCADKVIGGTGVDFLGIEEGTFLKKKTKATKLLMEAIKKHKPSKIFTHSDDDPHPDHKAVSSIVLSIFDKLDKSMQKNTDIYTFDVWTPVKVKERHYPKFIVPIKDTFRIKLRALKCFDSQWVAMVMLLWSVYVRAIKNGVLHGTLLAEKFYKVR